MMTTTSAPTTSTSATTKEAPAMTTSTPTRPRRRAALSATLALSLGALLGACGDGDGDENSACPSDQEFFEKHVYGPVLSMRCATCHNPEGLAKDSRMVLKAEGEEGYLEHNMAIARELAQESVDGTSLLLLKPTNEHPDEHKGGMVLTRDSA